MVKARRRGRVFDFTIFNRCALFDTFMMMVFWPVLQRSM